MRSLKLEMGSRIKFDGAEFKVEQCEPNGQMLLRNVETQALFLHSREELLNAYRESRLLLAAPTQASGFSHRPLSDLPPSVCAYLRRCKHYLDAAMATDFTAYPSRNLRAIISKVAAEIGDPKPPAESTVYRWYKRYSTNGNDLRALIPRHEKKGSRSTKVSNEVEALFVAALDAVFKISPRSSMKSVETKLHMLIDEENTGRLPSLKLRAPNRRSLYRMLSRLNAFERSTLLDGPAGARRQFQINRTPHKVMRILERVEVDHTPLDYFLIDERSWLPLGRPMLTLLIDTYSRMILGYYLSFGSTSAAAVMGALRHAILPKALPARALPGVTIVHPWVAYGLMESLVLDNGLEFHGNDLELAALDLGIRLQYCPTRTPQFKGRVERVLKTINYSFAHQLPGTSLAKFHERGDYDPLKHAVLSLGEFRHAFEKWVLDDYAQTVHKGIRTTPWARWHEGLQANQPLLPASATMLERRIGKSAERSLRRDGIWLNNIRYSAASLQPILNEWGPGVRVRVVHNPENLGSIEVWAPGSHDPTTVPAVCQEYAFGLTLLQHQQLEILLRDAGKQAEDSEALLAARKELAASIEELMSSRKLRKRTTAARLHGKNSELPERRFVAVTGTETRSAPASVSTKPSSSRFTERPSGKYTSGRDHGGKQ